MFWNRKIITFMLSWGVQHKLDLLSSIERVFKNYGLIDKNNKILYDTIGKLPIQ